MGPRTEVNRFALTDSESFGLGGRRFRRQR